ncbi:MAG TPA: carbohydrate kinase family protein, partial [Planctomycetota bacterium]|nr:carbohydrate kinase family protein [Planctomycetota bacterium]
MPVKKGIAAAGNWIVDWVKIIDAYPDEERLANVVGVTRGGGGGAHNVLIDLARMKAPFPLYGIGFVGNDDDGRFLIEEAKQEKIDFSGIRVSLEHPTSFTDVMTVKSTGRRTFFHARGANALLEADDVDPGDCKILHLAYLLLLDKIDPVAPQLLSKIRSMGVKTSVDVVSETSERFMRVVYPALDHIDYLILNEIEAGEISGCSIRLPNGKFDLQELKSAARKLHRDNLVVVHLPEGAFAVSKKDGELWVPSRPVKSVVS